MDGHYLDKEPSHNPQSMEDKKCVCGWVGVDGGWGGGGWESLQEIVTSNSSGKSISPGISPTMLMLVLLGCVRVFSSM